MRASWNDAWARSRKCTVTIRWNDAWARSRKCTVTIRWNDTWARSRKCTVTIGWSQRCAIHSPTQFQLWGDASICRTRTRRNMAKTWFSKKCSLCFTSISRIKEQSSWDKSKKEAVEYTKITPRADRWQNVRSIQERSWRQDNEQQKKSNLKGSSVRKRGSKEKQKKRDIEL